MYAFKQSLTTLSHFTRGKLFHAGANVDIYKPTITTYDYNCPVSESGRNGQPGVGGPNKFNVNHPFHLFPFQFLSSHLQFLNLIRVAEMYSLVCLSLSLVNYQRHFKTQMLVS